MDCWFNTNTLAIEYKGGSGGGFREHVYNVGILPRGEENNNRVMYLPLNDDYEIVQAQRNEQPAAKRRRYNNY